jgi:hypothetical protein
MSKITSNYYYYSGGRDWEDGCSRPARAKSKTLFQPTNWVWWCMTVVPATQEVQVGGSLLRPVTLTPKINEKLVK